MIGFSCTCGNRLEVPEELAGQSIQCPECGLLTDIPTVSELAHFTEEGTYKVDANRPIVDDPDRMVELEIIYSKDKRDVEGNEIDLRTLPGRSKARGRHDSVDDFYDADHEEDDDGELELAPAAKPDVTERPKYDPETGELIRPLEVKKDPDQDVDVASIPIAKAALTYASADVTKPVSPLLAAVQLAMPMNLVVMFFMFLTHVFSGMMFVVASQVLFFIVPAWLFLQGLMLAHYGNVIDETGRNEHDELPRPLRDLSWYDDMWSPFVSMFGGIMIAFLVPGYVLSLLGKQAGIPPIAMWLIAAVVGTVMGPAVLLTTNTSGSAFNLRPDRLLHVVRICGWHYLPVTILWTFTWPILMLGWLGFCVSMRDVFNISLRNALPDGSIFVTTPALLLGIYLMHWFCWYLGLLYRAHHAQFPWVLQRHIRDPNKQRVNHANKLGRRRPVSGHLVVPPVEAPSAPPPPPPPAR